MLSKTTKVAPTSGSTMIIVEVTQRSDPWLEWRSNGVTATDIPVILGLSPYKTVWQLWAEKTGQINTPDLSNNPNVQRGVKMEDTVRQLTEERYDDILLPLCGECVDYPILRASFDGVDLEHEVYEFKCPSDRVFDELQELGKKSETYELYEAQVHAQCVVSGNPKGKLIFFKEGEDLLIFDVLLTKAKCKTIIKEAKVFWDQIQTKTPPKTDPERDWFIPDDGNEHFMWQSTAEQWRLIHSKIKDLKDKLKLLETEKKGSQTKLISLMGQYQQADHSGVKISRFTKQGSVDYQTFLQEKYPDEDFDNELESYRRKSRSEARFTLSGDQLVNEDESVLDKLGQPAYF